MSKCQDNLAHYTVTGPEMIDYEYIDGVSMGIPHPYTPWTELLAPNSRAAIKAAIHEPEFKEWVQEARADGVNPFKGLKAERFLCSHGTCLGCLEVCAECEIELKAWLEADNMSRDIPELGSHGVDTEAVS